MFIGSPIHHNHTMFYAILLRFPRVFGLLEFCVLIVAVQSFSGGSSSPTKGKSCKCFKVKDDGFFSKRYKPQPQQDQDVGDQCIKINDCKPSMGTQYREYDGRCNNLEFPMWGKSGNALVRLLQPKYGDGISSQRKAEDGGELPNERAIRTAVLPNKNIKDKKLSDWFSVFGQWISHDVARTDPAIPGGACCKDGKTWPESLPANCSSTRVSEKDEFYSEFGVTCLSRTRSLTTDDFGCHLEPQQLWNPVTAYVDASLLYGTDANMAKQLKRGERGQLLTSVVDKREFPLMTPSPQESCDVRDGDKPVCFAPGGDARASENPPIAVIATIFSRFHNDFAGKLFELRPDWEEWRVFEETRRIVIAVTILILRKEWLPKFIGQDFMEQANMTFKNTEFDEAYNPECNAGTLSEFMHSAYRGGHSTIVDSLKLAEGKETQKLVIGDWINRPSIAVDRYDLILKSATTCPMARQDKWFSFDMSNKLFKGKEKWGLDLESTSIAREREAGFGGYVHYLENLLHEPEVKAWDDLKKYFTENTLASLKTVYKHYRDIDMYVGGLLECPVGESLFGKLFTAIIADQFARWLLCDRHSPTLKDGPGAFTLPQLQELNKLNMTFLVCKFSDNLDTVPEKPFELGSKSIYCRSLSDIDLSPWKKAD